MKTSYSLQAALIITAMLLAVALVPQSVAQTTVDDIAVGRDTLKAERTAAIAEGMQLSEEEGKVFWPLYREYWSAAAKISDDLLKIVMEYADRYPNVPEDWAQQTLKNYMALEAKYLETRTAYLNKAAKTLTAAKALRLAQLENRLDLAVRIQMANAIPLVPVKAK